MTTKHLTKNAPYKVPMAGKLAQPAQAWLRGRMRARAKRGSCRLHHRRATRAGPHPALRATFSRARARAKGKCEANLTPMRVRGIPVTSFFTMRDSLLVFARVAFHPVG